jgi:hypothetical protein
MGESIPLLHSGNNNAPSRNAVFRFPDMSPFASRASARFGEAHAIIENIPAFHALRRLHKESLLSGNQGSPDMGEMIVDLFFTDSQGRG